MIGILALAATRAGATTCELMLDVASRASALDAFWNGLRGKWQVTVRDSTPTVGFISAPVRLAVVLILSLTWTSLSLAVEGNPAGRNPIIVYTMDPAARGAGGPAEQLLQRARQQRQVRVIVGLRTVMRMEHTLSNTEVTAQRQALTQLQDSVIARVFGSTSVRGVDRFQFIPYMSMFVNAGQLSRLLADPQVVSIQEDVPVAPALSESVPLVNADEVWGEGFTGRGQVIAVLDTGVDKTHLMFSRKVVSEACYSTTNAAHGTTSVCPGGVESSTAPGSGVNCPLAVRGCDHGTHVASIAAGSSALHNVDGIAQKGRLITVQVFSQKGDKVSSFESDQIKGLERVYALRNTYEIAAVNMSLGGGAFAGTCDAQFPAMTTAIRNLRSVGIATVIAAGNGGATGTIAKPACISKAIAVGNTTKSDLLESSSDHSSRVKLLAPGTDIRAAVPAGASCITGDTPYCRKTGTSMAAPHVAGAFALLKEAKPTASVDDIVDALTCSGKIIHRRIAAGGGTVRLNALRKPRIDLIGAYNELEKPPGARRLWLFSDVDEGKDWSPLRGRWSVRDGTYQLTPNVSGWVGSSVSNCHSGLEVVAKMRATGTQQFGTAGILDAGIFMAWDVNHTSKEAIGVLFSYSHNAIGTVTGWLRGGVATWNFGTGVLSRSLSCEVFQSNVPGSRNTLKVVKDGTFYRFFFNDLTSSVCQLQNIVNPPVDAVMVLARVPDPPDESAFDVSSVQIKAIRENPAAAAEVAIMDPAAFVPTTATAGVSSRGVSTQ